MYLGEHDFAKPTAIELLGCFINPFVIYHHGGHEIPKLGNFTKF